MLTSYMAELLSLPWEGIVQPETSHASDKWQVTQTTRVISDKSGECIVPGLGARSVVRGRSKKFQR
jgi:hypothetical protein